MKKTLLTLCLALVLALPMQLKAQGSDIPYAADFTLVDINGTTHHLYEYLDSGKVVLFDVSAVWCGPCWTLHQTHLLQQMHEQYGPEGTVAQDMIVLWFEGDRGTLAQLQGQGNGTQGNWLNGVTHPMILNAQNQNNTVGTDYNIRSFPTVYMIFPDRSAKSLYVNGVSALNSVAACRQYMQQHMPTASTTPDLKVIQSSEYLSHYVCQNKFTHKVLIQNRSSEDITTANIHLKIDGNEVHNEAWTGNCKKYQAFEVTLPEQIVTEDGNHTVEVTVSAEGETNTSDNSKSTNFIVHSALQPTPAEQKFTTRNAIDWELVYWFPINLKTGAFLYNITFPGYFLPEGEKGSATALPYDVSTLSEPAIKFKWSYAPYTKNGQTNNRERLQVLARKGCEDAQPVVLFDMSGTNGLQTATPTSNYFQPTSARHWKDTVIRLGNDFGGSAIITFLGTSGYGNNLYIDDFKIGEYQDFLSLNQYAALNGNISVYPNPVNTTATFEMQLKENATVNYTITNMVGQTIFQSGNTEYGVGNHTIRYDASPLANGTYLVTFNVNGISSVHKMTVLR